MNLSSILFGQTIRIVSISGPGGGNIYGLNLAKACEARYGFLQGPRVLKDFDATEGITLLHGYFQGRIVIDRFQVFAGGFLAEAKADTDEVDAFLDDVTQWVQQQGGVRLEQNPAAARFYVSHVEMQSSVMLEQAFGEFHDFGREIAVLLRGYNQMTPDFSLTGFTLAGGPEQRPAPFRFEARVDRPPGFYFCTAPLRTADHIGALNSLESILLARFSSGSRL
jgi:hypothetical protein